MNRKGRIVILLCVAAISMAVVWLGFHNQHLHEGMENNLLSTDGVGYMEADIPHADSLIVGKWQNSENPHWFKVYYDDFDEKEGLFWGKEWNESDDVTEEDLNYHGNGWFRWERKGNTLREYVTMDVLDVPIYRAYTILLSKADSLAYRECDRKNNLFHFSRKN